MLADDIVAFLHEPLRMAQVAAVSPQNNPLLGSLWFLFEDGRFWFSSHPTSPLVTAARHNQQIAVIVDEFTPPESIRQIRVRGPGSVADHDSERVTRIYQRYLGADLAAWPAFFRERATDREWALWNTSPTSGVATVNPEFRPSEVRWADLASSPLPDPD